HRGSTTQRRDLDASANSELTQNVGGARHVGPRFLGIVGAGLLSTGWAYPDPRRGDLATPPPQRVGQDTSVLSLEAFRHQDFSTALALQPSLATSSHNTCNPSLSALTRCCRLRKPSGEIALHFGAMPPRFSSARRVRRSLMSSNASGSHPKTRDL